MNLKHFTKTDIRFDDRIIKEPKFIQLINDDNISLSDPVVVYNDGRKWKFILLDIVKSYPIVYDKYYEKFKKNGKLSVSDITLTYCPYSSSVLIYFGKYKPTGEVYNNNLIISDNINSFVMQITGIEYNRTDQKRTNKLIRRAEAKIMTLRDILTMYPDCKYLDFTNNKDPILSEKYTISTKINYKNDNYKKDYHPKTLVYGIEYLSSNTDSELKYTVIIPKDAKKDKINSYNIKENKIDDYFNPKMIEKIRDKSGIIIPCYYFAWTSMFPQTKVVKL
jgi:hypothetical protein